MKPKNHLSQIKMGVCFFLLSIFILFPIFLSAQSHPLDGLSPEEYKKIQSILKKYDYSDENTLFPLIELIEPEKSAVMNYKNDTGFDRKAMINFTSKGAF